MYKFNFLRKSGYENKNQEKNILSLLQDTEFLKSYKYNMEWQQCYTVRNGKWFEDVLREKCEPLGHKEQFEERWKIKEQIIKAGGNGPELLSLSEPLSEMRKMIRNLRQSSETSTFFHHNFNFYWAGRFFVCFYLWLQSSFIC